MNTLARILITPGEPAGIGPDVTVQIAGQNFDAELVVVGDPELFTSRAKKLNLPLTLIPLDAKAAPHRHVPGTLKIIPIALDHTVTPGTLNQNNADYVINTLKAAADYCKQHMAQAIVTGPVHKGILNDAGLPFTGHTEFLAEMAGSNQSIMLFVTPKTKVALLTTHLPLVDVPRAITREKLKNTLRLLHQELRDKFHLADPAILVCGLNPHAGEYGHLGREEIDIISPVINELKNEMSVDGPLPADTIFTDYRLKKCDAILAMYHDQALPVVKYMGLGQTVNVTLGLPFIRTSVDHGVALDVAGTGRADPQSFITAIHLAIELARTRS